MLFFKMMSRNLLRVYPVSIRKNIEFLFTGFFSYTSNYCPNQVRLYKIFQTVIPAPHKMTVLSNVRLKSKKNFIKSHEKNEDDDKSYDDEETDDEDEERNIKGVEVKAYSVQSLRIDLILRKSLGQGKKAVDEFLYQNKLRLNGRHILKKGGNVKVGDVIDIIQGVSAQNANCLIVHRIEILDINVADEETNFIINLRKTKHLTIENYQGSNKFQPSSSQS